MAKLPLLSNLIIISQFHYPFFVPNMNFKRKHLFKMEMFCNIIHFFIVIIDQCNASLLDKKVFEKVLLMPKLWMLVYIDTDT